MVNKEWNFENNRGSDYSYKEIFQLIKRYIDINSENEIKLIHHGTFNVYEVHDFIFRVPDKTLNNQKGFNIILNENKKLNFLRGHLNTPIPKPLFLSDDETHPIVGYEKIPGTSLDKIWFQIPEDKKECIARDISSFLNIFHSPLLQQKYIQQFNAKKLTNLDLKHSFEEIFSKTKITIFPIITLKSKIFIEQIFKNYFKILENSNFSSCLTHQDFDTSNILIDPETFKLTGIIDFEDMNIGDPAYDLIFISEGKKFYDTVLSNYKNFKDNTLEDRILFYYKRMAVPYLLYGLEHNLKDMIEYGKFLLENRENFIQITG